MVWAAHGVNKYMKQDARLYVPFCVQYGYLDLTLFFLTEKKDAVSYFIRHGGYHGYLNMIEWVFINFPEEFDGNIISRNAACGGHIKILEYIEKLGKPLCKYLSLYGARHNHTNVIKWAKERGQTIWWSCLYFFVLNRNMELINLYLNESDAPLITSDCFLKACENDDLEILKLLYNKNRANYHKQICLEQVLEGSEIENWIINNTLDFYFVWAFFFLCVFGKSSCPAPTLPPFTISTLPKTGYKDDLPEMLSFYTPLSNIYTSCMLGKIASPASFHSRNTRKNVVGGVRCEGSIECGKSVRAIIVRHSRRERVFPISLCTLGFCIASSHTPDTGNRVYQWPA